MNVPLNRKARTTEEGLEIIRAALQGNALAQKHVARLLAYADSLLVQSERACRSLRSEPRAVVGYGGQTFTFVRL